MRVDSSDDAQSTTILALTSRLSLVGDPAYTLPGRRGGMMQRSILITGCSSGIGYDAAHTLAKRGWRVFATCRKAEDCDRLVAEGLESFVLDYADEASIAAAVDLLWSAKRPLVMIGAAGNRPRLVEPLSQRHFSAGDWAAVREIAEAIAAGRHAHARRLERDAAALVLDGPGPPNAADRLGEHAGDLLAEYVLAMKHGLGLNKILGTLHTYPTMAEANKYAAGEWKRAHAPQKLLAWVQKFHDWRRG